MSFPKYLGHQRRYFEDISPICNNITDSLLLLDEYSCFRKDGIDSFHAEWNKKPAKNPVKAESNRTHYLLNDEDLAQTIIPSEQRHHLTQDLIRISGSKVEIRPSLMTFSISKSSSHEQPKFDKWFEYPLKIESEETFIYLGCDEYTAGVVFKGWERLGNEYIEKVNYRKQNRILRFKYEFAILVIENENIFKKNLSRPLGLTSDESGTNEDPSSGNNIMTDDCTQIGKTFSQLRSKHREQISQRKSFELKTSELEGNHHASILRVLQARLGTATPEFAEACRYYLADGLSLAESWINLAAEKAYTKAFPRIRTRRDIFILAGLKPDDEKGSTSRPASDTVGNFNLFWPKSAKHKSGREEHTQKTKRVDSAAKLSEQRKILFETLLNVYRSMKELKQLLRAREGFVSPALREWVNSVIEANLFDATIDLKISDLLLRLRLYNQSLTTAITVLSSLDQTKNNSTRAESELLHSSN